MGEHRMDLDSAPRLYLPSCPRRGIIPRPSRRSSNDTSRAASSLPRRVRTRPPVSPSRLTLLVLDLV